MRTRMYGGVGGEEPRGFPLSRCVPSMFDSSNAMNHSTWFVSDMTVTSTTFGNITSRFYGNRLVQFALYYRF